MTSRIFAALLALFFAASVQADDRVLKFFDFDERAAGNVEDLPMNWAKVEGTGFPTYLRARLVRGVGLSSPYSFQFDLNGGSLLYRYDGKDLPARAGGRYRVEAQVKTTVLDNARARITLQLLDQDFHAIPGARVDSPLYASPTGSAAEWKPLAAEIRAADPRTAYIRIDVGLLQPNQYAGRTLGDRTIFNQDVRGSAWFTDIVVSQVPELTVEPVSPGGLFAAGQPMALKVSINDRLLHDLSASLELSDASGRVVHQQTGPISPAAPSKGPLPGWTSPGTSGGAGTWQQVVSAPAQPAGWYQARLTVQSGGHVVSQRVATLVQLADGEERHQRIPDVRIGLAAGNVPPRLWSQLPELVSGVYGGRLKLALWSPESDVQTTDAESFQNLLLHLSDLGIRPTACLTGVPPGLAEVIGGSSLEDLARADPALWREALKLLVARHASHLDRWQLGADGSDLFARNTRWQKFRDTVRDSISELVPQSDMSIPWPALYETDKTLTSEFALAIPSSVLPEQIPLYVADVRDRTGRTFSIGLSPLDPNRYGRDVCTRDYVQRVVWSLAAGAGRIDLPLPCRISDDGRRLEPEELYPVLRALAFWLSDANYAGRVPVADGVDGFLFERNGTGVIVAWTTKAEGKSRPFKLDVPGNARVFSCHGESALATRDGSGSLSAELSSLPIIITNVDAGLARLKAAMAFDNPLLESSYQTHTRRIRLTNTLQEPISGMVRLTGTDGWRFLPGAVPFVLNPGESLDREVTIEFPYNTPGGPHAVDATLALTSPGTQQLHVPLQLKLGLSDIGMQSIVVRDGTDLVVQQIVTNYGTKPANYTSFAVLAGQARQEKLITNLGPGQSMLKRYRFVGAAAAAPAARVRVGIREINGPRMLNDELSLQ